MKAKNNNNINIKNKRASFDYEIIDTLHAGIVLTGTEIKSIREGKAGLADTFCYVYNGEVWVKNMYIADELLYEKFKTCLFLCYLNIYFANYI